MNNVKTPLVEPTATEIVMKQVLYSFDNILFVYVFRLRFCFKIKCISE